MDNITSVAKKMPCVLVGGVVQLAASSSPINMVVTMCRHVSSDEVPGPVIRRRQSVSVMDAAVRRSLPNRFVLTTENAHR
jgi:hypothetical protein